MLNKPKFYDTCFAIIERIVIFITVFFILGMFSVEISPKNYSITSDNHKLLMYYNAHPNEKMP